MSNFDTFLTRLRWDSTYENFTDMTSFRTDSIVYEFKTPLSKKDQNAFIDFLGDSKHLKTIMPDDFCNFFLNHRIEFEIKFQYDFNLPFKQNYRYLKTIRILRKSLKEWNQTDGIRFMQLIRIIQLRTAIVVCRQKRTIRIGSCR